MRVCFVSPEVFAFGYYGGLGRTGITWLVSQEVALGVIGSSLWRPLLK